MCVGWGFISVELVTINGFPGVALRFFVECIGNLMTGHSTNVSLYVCVTKTTNYISMCESSPHHDADWSSCLLKCFNYTMMYCAPSPRLYEAQTHKTLIALTCMPFPTLTCCPVSFPAQNTIRSSTRQTCSFYSAVHTCTPKLQGISGSSITWETANEKGMPAGCT